MEFSVRKDGLASFSDLDKRFGVRNFVTYDNKIWGNMVDVFTMSDLEKQRILKNDQKIARLLRANTACIMTTPPEDTFIDLTSESLETIRMGNPVAHTSSDDIPFYPVRANAVILTVPNVEIVAAPADCVILVMKQTAWDGMIVMHIGSSQVLQNLAHKVLTYFSAAYPCVNIGTFEVFAFPYLCPRHYIMNGDKAKMLRDFDPEIDKYFIPTELGSNDGFAFWDYSKDKLQKEWGIQEFYESGVCTWEMAEKGNLFSHRYASRKQKAKGTREGRFNVAVSMAVRD